MAAYELPDALLERAQEQAQVLLRRQLQCHLTRAQVRAQLDGGRWQAVGPFVVVLHNGPLTGEQKTWVALLSAPGAVAVAGRHAARLGGLKNWRGAEPEIVVPRGTRFPDLPFPVAVHESRRFSAKDIDRSALPRTTLERSVVDAATWTDSPRAACGLLCAAVQQRLTTADRLLRAVRLAGRVRHCAVLRAVLVDIAGGAHALSEVEFGRFLAQHHLPAPRRQAVRLDNAGKRRYLDVELEGPTGELLHVEIDGALHLLVNNYWSDMDRDNELVLSGTRLLRFPSISWRLEPTKVADQIRRGLRLTTRQAA